MTARHELLAVLAACAALYLTGTADIPFHTRGEPREGLVVREMLATGEWLVPARPAGEVARKPPLYYWLAAIALRLRPEAPEQALRLPSAVLATAAVVGTWATARTVWGPAAGLPAALVLASAFEWTRAATAARVDMTLAAALTAVVLGWILTLARDRPGGALVLAAAGALAGTLAKGPVALILPALAAGVLAVVRRDQRVLARLRPWVVLGAAAAGAGLWYAAAFLRGGDAFLEVVARENLTRFIDAEDHAHGIWYLVPLGLVGLLPWSPLLPLAVGAVRARPRTTATVFAAVWIVVGFVFFSLAQAKRSVYLLPIYPAVALLVGAGAAAPPDSGWLGRTAAWGARLLAPAMALIALLAFAMALGVDPAGSLRPWLKPADAAGAAVVTGAIVGAAPVVVALALATLAASIALAAAARRAAWPRLIVLVAALMVAWTAFFDTVVFPVIARSQSLRVFLTHVRTVVPPAATLYARFPADPGLRFYAGRDLRPWPRGGLATDGHLLLWEDEWRALRTPAGEPLRVVAVSDARQAGRGHLALVIVPPGPLVRAPAPAAVAPHYRELRAPRSPGGS